MKVGELVERIYGEEGLSERAMLAAEKSVMAHLIKLLDEGKVERHMDNETTRTQGETDFTWKLIGK